MSDKILPVPEQEVSMESNGINHSVTLGFLGLILLVAGCSSGDASSTADLTRCQLAPDALVNQLSMGLTAAGDASVSHVYVVQNNDGRPWQFIGGRLRGPGLDEAVAVWATASLDLDDLPLLVAADSMAAEFSIWDFPGGNRFADVFDDEMVAAKQCARSAP